MKTKTIIILIILVSMHACKTPKTDNKSQLNPVTIDNLFESYYNERMELYPLEATLAGDYQYNDLLPNNLTSSYKNDLKQLYSGYQNKLKSYDRNQLDETDQDSYDILNWECNMNLEGLQFKQELLPINQIWSLHLHMGQLASGRSIQPFRNTEDYDNWLKRMEAFVVWCDTAIVNMKKGMQTRHVLPKPLIIKILPQMAAFAAGPAKDHLFSSPGRSFPDEI